MGIYHSLINKAVAMHDEGRVAHHHHHRSTPILNIPRMFAWRPKFRLHTAQLDTSNNKNIPYIIGYIYCNRD